MTHQYTLLIGGTVIPDGGEPDATAIAWAGDTILAIGTDDEVRAISRGDSHLFDLGDACVSPLEPGTNTASPTGAPLEIGGRADLAVLDCDPRRRDPGDPEGLPPRTLAIVRGGRVVAGALPEGTGHDSDTEHDPHEEGGHSSHGPGADHA